MSAGGPLSHDDRLALEALAGSTTAPRKDLAQALARALAEIDRMDKMLSRDYKDPFPVVVATIGTTSTTIRGYDAVVTIVADGDPATSTRVRCQVRENGQNRRRFDLTGELAAYVWPLLRAAAQRGARKL